MPLCQLVTDFELASYRIINRTCRPNESLVWPTMPEWVESPPRTVKQLLKASPSRLRNLTAVICTGYSESWTDADVKESLFMVIGAPVFWCRKDGSFTWDRSDLAVHVREGAGVEVKREAPSDVKMEDSPSTNGETGEKKEEREWDLIDFTLSDDDKDV